jgi:carbamoyltransferase
MGSKPSIVLGISFGHGDSSAALIVDGVLVAAAEEERFTRIKHYALFPALSVHYCLTHAGISAADVRVVALARKPMNFFAKRLALYLSHPALFRFGSRAAQRGESLSHHLSQAGLKRAKIVRVEHHMAHLLSARCLVPKEEPALLSFDGLGDFVSTAIAKSNGAGAEILYRTFFPHSLGFFYTALTQFLGFPHHGDEFKVMGLSSYGEPTQMKAMRELIREREDFGFEINLEAFPILKRPIDFTLEKGQPKIGSFYNTPMLTALLGFAPRKHKDPIMRNHWNLAKSVQLRFEEIGTHLLKQLHAHVPSDTVALAGGCAHNSVWVGKIPSLTPFKKVVVAPASHDAGIAVGAAIAASGVEVSAQGDHWGLLGPSHEESTATTLSDEKFEIETYEHERQLIQDLAKELANGKILGLFRGRMEFGPRALGARSIICDPRSPEMKDKLNARVKHREAFRPFAASVLEEHQEEWFENVFYSPTMEAVFSVKENQRKKIPAVVHVDNTCRIQSVSKDTQPFYWNLIEAFRKKSGVPMLLNTSFNDCEPIVCNENEAVECFLNTDMDILVLGNKVITRKTSSLAKTA